MLQTVKLDKNKQLVIVKLRRYPPDQTLLLKKYRDDLIQMGSFIPNSKITW